MQIKVFHCALFPSADFIWPSLRRRTRLPGYRANVWQGPTISEIWTRLPNELHDRPDGQTLNDLLPASERGAKRRRSSFGAKHRTQTASEVDRRRRWLEPTAERLPCCIFNHIKLAIRGKATQYSTMEGNGSDFAILARWMKYVVHSSARHDRKRRVVAGGGTFVAQWLTSPESALSAQPLIVGRRRIQPGCWLTVSGVVRERGSPIFWTWVDSALNGTQVRLLMELNGEHVYAFQREHGKFLSEKNHLRELAHLPTWVWAEIAGLLQLRSKYSTIPTFIAGSHL